MNLLPPEPLADHHSIGEFNCGEASLDEWLRKRARANQATGASRTYVLCEGERVLGYYALSSGAVRMPEAPGRFRRNMPDPIPVVVLGRLAVDRNLQGKGTGRALVRDALTRIYHASEIIGIRGILVHALTAQAKAFYEAVGFEPSPIDATTLMATINDLRDAGEF